MSDDSKQSLGTWLILFALAFIWGSSYILMKKGLVVFTPIEVAAIRFMLSGLVLLPFLPRAIKKFPKRLIRYLMIVSFLGSGIPAFIYAYSISKTSSSLNGIINTLTPVFTLFIGVLIFRIPATRRKISGILIGFIGCVFLMLSTAEGQLSFNFFALLTVVATICYGYSSNILKEHFGDMDALELTSLMVWPLVVPYVIIFAFQADWTIFQNPTTDFWWAFGYISILAILGTSFAGVLFNILIQRTNALFASTVTYIMPVIAIGWGLLDGERIAWDSYAGLALILLGLYLATRKERKLQKSIQ